MTDLFTESVIADMKKSLMAAADKGARCPCCNQMFKIYKIPMNGTQVSLLKNAYLQHGLGWFHISSLRNHDSGSGAFAKLRYYGFLVEQVHDGNPKKRTSGIWRVTEDGAKFLKGELRVRKKAVILTGNFLGLDGELVSVFDVMGETFNYQKLMED